MDIKQLLIDSGFRYNKALGQNFITDGNLLEAVVKDAGITSEDTVIEIGTGAGTLTGFLSENAKTVISFEVDRNLEKILNNTLKDCQNVKVVFDDIMKMSDEQIISLTGGSFKVVANLPYYITTPIIMRFIESKLPVSSLTLMMQKEVADRLTAKPGTKDYGAITAVLDLISNVRITRNINRQMFYPVPKVDSALIFIEIDKNKYKIEDMVFVKKIIKSAFMWRRKTLANNINSVFSLPKKDIENSLLQMNLQQDIRGEKLSTDEFIILAERLKELKAQLKKI